MAKLKKSSGKTARTTTRKSGAGKVQAGLSPKSITESAQQIWLAGMGAFNRAQSEGSKLFETLVRDGLSLEQTRDNLEAMIRAAQAADARVLLVGMRIPPNYGPDYTAGFEANFRELAEQYDTAFLPFLLEPVAMDDAAFQSDRIHPTAEAQPALRDHAWPVLEPMLQIP